jgi:hypothetical protein
LLPVINTLAVRNRQQQATDSSAGPTNTNYSIVRTDLASSDNGGFIIGVFVRWHRVGSFPVGDIVYRVWFFIMEWLIVGLCVAIEVYDWCRSVWNSSGGWIVWWLLLSMSIFKKLARWPWRKIIRVIVVIVQDVINELKKDDDGKQKP